MPRSRQICLKIKQLTAAGVGDGTQSGEMPRFQRLTFPQIVEFGDRILLLGPCSIIVEPRGTQGASEAISEIKAGRNTARGHISRRQERACVLRAYLCVLRVSAVN